MGSKITSHKGFVCKEIQLVQQNNHPKTDKDGAPFRGGGCGKLVWAATKWQWVSIFYNGQGVCA